jgi:hypothetical protein
LFLPAEENAIAARATEVISELARHLDWYEGAEDLLEAIATESIERHEIPTVSEEILHRYGSSTAPDDAPGFGNGVWDEVLRQFPALEPSAAWLEQPAADTLKVKSGVNRACQLIGEVATRLAPRFIRDRYSLDVSVAPRALLAGGTPVGFGLTLRADPGALGAISFGIDDVAAGYRIWIQFALLHGIAAVSRLTQDLFNAADDIVWGAHQVADANASLLSAVGLGYGFIGGQTVKDLAEGQEVLTQLATISRPFAATSRGPGRRTMRRSRCGSLELAEGRSAPRSFWSMSRNNTCIPARSASSPPGSATSSASTKPRPS